MRPVTKGIGSGSGPETLRCEQGPGAGLVSGGPFRHIEPSCGSVGSFLSYVLVTVKLLVLTVTSL